MAQDFTDNFYDSSHVAHTDMGNAEDNFTALKSSFSGTSAPSNTVAGMFWYDTTANMLKIRNEADIAWQSIWDFGNNRIPTIPNDFVVSAMLNSTSSAEAVTTDVIRDEAITDAKLADDSISDSKLTYPTAGTNLIGRNDDQVTASGTSYYIRKQYVILRAGTYTVSFRMKSVTSGQTAYGRIYNNGASFGSIQSTTSTTFSAKSENLTFAVGDHCALYAKTNGSTTGWYDEFRLYDNDNFGLVVPVAYSV